MANFKKIVIINQDSGYLIVDIANALSDIGFEVSLITGRLVNRNRVLYKTVNLRKIIRYNRNTKFHRTATWIIGFLQIIFLVITRFRQDYLAIVSNPPLNSFLPLICRNRFSLIVFDIYPDALVELGIASATSFGINLWRKINEKIYPRADRIFTLTEGMAARLSLYARKQSMKVIPIWTDNEFIKPLPKWLNPFVKEYSLINKFVILYSGNLGITHNIEILPKLAALVNNPNILFLIIGDGDKRHWLKEIIEKKNLRNCLLLPLQPVEMIPFTFAAADLSIVSLSKAASNLSIPSKTFNYMSAGIPLLCIADEKSEIHRLVQKYDNGKCFIQDQIIEMLDFINELLYDKTLQEYYSCNSLKASGDFNYHNAEEIAEEIKKSIKEVR